MSSIIEINETVAVAGATRKGRPRRQYRCAFCQKAFKRSEHCIRHERTHTQEKPFDCRYCSKSYSRKDLVTRHEKTLHAQAHRQRLRLEQEDDQDPDPDPDAEYVAEQVNVAFSAIARPLTLGTPPDDEPETDSEAEAQNRNPSVAKLLSPENEVALSLSPPSSSSSNMTVSNGRCVSLADPAHNASIQAQISSNSAKNSHSNPRPSTAFVTDSHTFNLAPPSNRYSNKITFDPHSEDRSPTGMIDADITSGLRLNADVQMSGDGNLTHQQLQQPSTTAEQDPTQFIFSPMPSFDIDLSAFAFSPIHNQFNQDRNHGSSNLPLNDLGGVQQFSADTNQVFLSWPELAPNPLPLFGVPRQPTNEQHTAKSHSNHDLPVLQDKRQAYTCPDLNDFAYEAMRNDLFSRQKTSDVNFEIPSAKVCRGFLSTYVTSFHGHLPIIHMQSFSPMNTPSPLLLAMCSIGALYRLDRRRARKLYDVATRSLEIVPHPPQDSDITVVKDYYLWYGQARLLLSFYAIMSGDKDLVLDAIHQNGFYTLLYSKTRTALEGHTADLSRITWQQWIERESWKRLLGAIFLTSTLTMVLFDVNPVFNATQDLDFEAFQDEDMWDATTSNEWRQIRKSNLSKYKQQRRTMNDVLIDIMHEGRYHGDTAPYQVSAFAALILMHGVVVQMWQRFQVSHAMLSLTDSGLLGSLLMDSAMATLARCNAFLKSAGSEPGGLDSEVNEETSLSFNCQAILRLAYLRLFEPMSPSNRISLIGTDPAEMDEAITSFVTKDIERSPHMLSAVTKCFAGLRIPVKLGTMLIRKTAAFSWSVDHAVADWESAQLVTGWIHSVEVANRNGVPPSPEEQKFLEHVKDVLEEAECDLDESFSLAAGVARTWGWFLRDVWIWGITPRMGAALEQLAKAYEDVGKDNRR